MAGLRGRVPGSLGAAESTPHDPAPTGGLRGQYFADKELDNLAVTRLDPAIDFDWGDGAPDVEMPVDGFSVRWTGEIWIEDDGAATFVTVSNDGVRLWIDGYQVIDNWTNHGDTEDTGQIRLEGGRWYPITLEYYDDARDALIVLAYESERSPRTVVSSDRLRPPAEAPAEPSPGGLRGEYFDDEWLTDLEVVRIEPSIDFDWDDGSPDPLLGSDGFSIRWAGEFLSEDTGAYEFTVTSDDGVRLWVGDQLVIDDWTTRPATENVGTVDLTGGSWHTFRVEYFDAAGNAEIRVRYRAPGGAQGAIPSDQLRPAVDGPVAASTSAAPPSGEPATPAATPAATPVSPELASPCETTIQALVDAATPGDTVTVPPCIYRESIVITKPLTLDGQGQAEIRGSDVWSTGWIQRGDLWIHFNPPELPYPHGWCRGESERCHWPHQVFLDGAALVEVAAEPKPGEFAIEDETIVLADDPNGRAVEVTARPFWIVAESDDVTISGFTMRHAGNPAQTAAITIDGYSNWTVRDNTLLDTHGTIVAFKGGQGFSLTGNEIARSGIQGAGASEATDIVIADNRIHDNNTEDFDPGWSSGGIKSALVERMVVERNEVYANNGPGIWCDIDCADVTMSQNLVHHNERQGIQYELSRDAAIHSNWIWENGWGFSEWCFGAGIVLQNSASVEVRDNVLAWNAHGITVISQDRGGSWNDVTQIAITDNVVVSAGNSSMAHAYCQDWEGGVLFDPSSNNRSLGNRYWYPNPECLPETEASELLPIEWCGHGRFGWGNEAIATLTEFNILSGYDNGTYLTDTEKEAALVAAGIPLSPEEPGFDVDAGG